MRDHFLKRLERKFSIESKKYGFVLSVIESVHDGQSTTD